MSSVYDRVAAGEGVLWPGLNEEEKYSIWSLHLERGGGFMLYPEFCDVMDQLSARYA